VSPCLHRADRKLDLLNLGTLEEAGLELQLEELDLRDVLGEQRR
jgi:hypothetical protein